MIFINLTNHPSEKWSEEQLTAAEAYGEIVDMAFPVIDENAAEADIQQLAEQYLKEIKALGEPQDLTVHIMGEQTFCFALISKLQETGIRCVASCTERDTHINELGEKVSTFHFTQFREYATTKSMCVLPWWKQQMKRLASCSSKCSQKKDRNFFSKVALWLVLLFELLLISDLQQWWSPPYILFVVVVCLLFALYGAGRYYGHHFGFRTTIVTKLLANAVAPTTLGAVYLLVFVIHIGWLTNAALGWYTATDEEFCRVLYSTAACVLGMAALIAFFPKSGEQKVARPQQVFVSGISSIGPAPAAIANMKYDTLNLLPLVRMLQLIRDDDQVPLLVILQSDAFEDTPAQDEAFKRVMELVSPEACDTLRTCEGLECKIRLLIRELAKREFPDKKDLIDAMVIEFTEACNYFQNFEKAYSVLQQKADELDDEGHQLYFNLTPGTGIISSLMTLMSIDGDRSLYYYSQEKMPNADTATEEEKRAFSDRLLLPVDKKQIPLQALLSQALEKLD